jgi:hypothetical protein
MITMQAFQPTAARQYTDRSIVYYDFSRIGMVAHLEGSWIVSTHPDDPQFETKQGAIDYLVSMKDKRETTLSLVMP